MPIIGGVGPDTWLAGFLRGLTIGALVGSAIAGTAIVRRLLGETRDDGGTPEG
jgi:hypothetical protein